jgi:DNA-binding CsgD family transcriptional regulator
LTGFDAALVSATMSDDASLIERGLAAMERGAWQEARACFATLVEREPSGAAYEGLSWAAWSLNEPDLLFEAREKAYRLYRHAQDTASAARMAMWLGADYIDFRGDLSIGNGWRQRARRLLDDLPTTPEHGWLLLLEGDVALMAEEDAPKARELARRAVEIGRALSVLDIETIGLAMEGVALVTEGEVRHGMRLLEEASAAALSGEISDPGHVAWALCYLIYACERVRDYDRAAEWCDKMREYADTGQMALLRGICRVRFAGVLIWRGDWRSAERQLVDAARRFVPQRGRRAADGIARLAELRHRQGRLKEAEGLFREVEWHPLALLGLAELALEAGRPKDAEELIDRLLRQAPVGSLTQRAAAFELLVRVEALLGDHTRARQALEAVQTLAAVADTPPLRAALRFSAGALAGADQRYDEAMACFEDAVDLYERCGAPYEAARARLELASVLVMLGRLERAEVEALLAHQVLEQLNSRFYAGRAAALQHDISRRLREADAKAAGRSQLTERQLDVLRLLARGLSNREIAAALFVSEHTVHRHVANILQRLDLPSRAAAAAYATRHNLI